MVAHCSLRAAHYLAYFYFSFSDIQRQCAESFLRTVVRQLLLQRSGVPDAVRDIYKRYQHTNPPIDVWKDALQSLINLGGQIYIIVDALDECPNYGKERISLLHILEALKSPQVPQLHLLATSRKETDIEAALLRFVTTPPLSIQNAEVDDDIRIHVKAQLENDPTMSKWPISVQEEVEQELIAKAGGM